MAMASRWGRPFNRGEQFAYFALAVLIVAIVLFSLKLGGVRAPFWIVAMVMIGAGIVSYLIVYAYPGKRRQPR